MNLFREHLTRLVALHLDIIQQQDEGVKPEEMNTLRGQARYNLPEFNTAGELELNHFKNRVDLMVAQLIEVIEQHKEEVCEHLK